MLSWKNIVPCCWQDHIDQDYRAAFPKPIQGNLISKASFGLNRSGFFIILAQFLLTFKTVYIMVLLLF